MSKRAARDEGPPPLGDESDSAEIDPEGESEDDSEDDSDGPPPPLVSSSGSEAETGPPKGATKTTRARSSTKPKAAASTAGDGKSRMAAAKPSGKGANAAGKDRESPLWTQFVKYRKNLDSVDRLGLVALKQWEAFEKAGSLPAQFVGWYADQIKGNRSVPHVLSVPKLPSGFPEFCHWLAGGHYKPTAGASLVQAGFFPMAEMHVKKVKEAEAPPAAAGRAAPAYERQQSTGSVSSANGNNTGANGAGAGAGPTNDPKMRKRERRRERRGNMGGANGSMFAEKMQSALAGLQEMDEDEGDSAETKSAAHRSMQAGRLAEQEFLSKMQLADDDDLADDEGGQDPNLPIGTRASLVGLRRARAYQRRGNRQFELVARELERTLARMTRLEVQYSALVAETCGQECTMQVALRRSFPLIQQAMEQLGDNQTVLSLENLNNVVKLLETHVGHPPVAGVEEPADETAARQMLGRALHNRAVVNSLLCNTFNAKDDSARAAQIWPSPETKRLADRCKDAHAQQLSTASPSSEWETMGIPP